MRWRGLAARRAPRVLVAATAAALAIAVAVADCGAERGGTPRGAAVAVLPVRVATDDLAGEHATAIALGAGRALTVAHVLRAGRAAFVGRERARVVRVDRRLDIAVLALPGLRAAAPARAAARAGERVTVHVLRDGAVRALPARVRRTITARLTGDGPAVTRPALELAATIAPGDSGAPVVDRAGRLTGIVFARATDRPGVAYALDARVLPPPPVGP